MNLADMRGVRWLWLFIAGCSTRAPQMRAPEPRRVQAPAPPRPPPDAGTAIAAGHAHTCALRPDGAVLCWGLDDVGQTGDGWSMLHMGGRRVRARDMLRPTPTLVRTVRDAVGIAAGYVQTCALLRGGEVVCWGGGNTGAGDDGDHPEPVRVSGLTDAVAISAHYNHTCALRRTGQVSCWGANDTGQCTPDRSVCPDDGTLHVSVCRAPAPLDFVSDAVEVRAGGSVSCARRSRGDVVCWGDNFHGALGVGRGFASHGVVAGLTDAVGVAVGLEHGCALRRGGQVVCWGRTIQASMVYEAVPVAVPGLDDAVELAAGDHFTCARTRDGRVRCWGEGLFAGEDGLRPEVGVPEAVEGVRDAAAIAAGGQHACAADRQGAIVCWGHNEMGQLGDGTFESRARAVAILSAWPTLAVLRPVVLTCSTAAGLQTDRPPHANPPLHAGPGAGVRTAVAEGTVDLPGAAS